MQTTRFREFTMRFTTLAAAAANMLRTTAEAWAIALAPARA